MTASIDSLETPAPLVDLDRLERNVTRAASYARTHNLSLRPHVKTHKSPFIARRQLRAGAAGVTCATPREVEVMRAVTNDILFAYPPIGEPKLRRLVSLPRDTMLTVALDSREAVEQLAAAAGRAGRAIRVYVELDVGMHRVGVPTVADAVALIRYVQQHAPLEYTGVAFYAGHIRDPVTHQDAKLEQLNRLLTTALEELDSAGVRPAVVSGGSTPTIWRTHELTGVTEFRPGTYVYNDRTTAEIGACDWDDCALTVLGTVVSTTLPGQAVVDAGSKALGREPMRGASRGARAKHVRGARDFGFAHDGVATTRR
jgi:D-serine deaminase-like pyridoxal phosphate-dependent protein